MAVNARDPQAPTKQPKDRTPPTGELGTSLTYSESLFSDYLDPAFGSVAWWEARDYATMLRTEPQARKVEQLLTLPALSAPRKISPGKGDKGECEWVIDTLTRPANNGGMSVPLGQVIAQMTTAVTFRVASFEKVWKEDGDRLVYDKLAFRPAINTRVMRDRKTGAYRGLRQDPPFGETDPIDIAADRAFTYTHGVHRSPILGSSDLEIPLVCWRAKQKLRFLWFLFLELHAQPRITTEHTGEVGGDHKTTKDAARLLSRMKGGGVIAMPPGVTANVVETQGRANELFLAALKYLDGEMTGQILAGFADLAGAANAGHGSLALSRDQSDFYMMSRRYQAGEMSEQFSNYVIADLVKHNFGPNASCPTLTIGPLAAPDLQVMTTLLGQLAPGGVGLPAEFTAFIVEATAEGLGMSVDQVSNLVDATTKAHEEAAATARQAALAKATGPIAAANHLVARAQQSGQVPAEAVSTARAAAAA